MSHYNLGKYEVSKYQILHFETQAVVMLNGGLRTIDLLLPFVCSYQKRTRCSNKSYFAQKIIVELIF